MIQTKFSILFTILAAVAAIAHVVGRPLPAKGILTDKDYDDIFGSTPSPPPTEHHTVHTDLDSILTPSSPGTEHHTVHTDVASSVSHPDSHHEQSQHQTTGTHHEDQPTSSTPQHHLVVAQPLPGNNNMMDWNTVKINPASGLPHWPKDSVDSVPAKPE
jgi:hypothetical protein